jgi:hypothetical protein
VAARIRAHHQDEVRAKIQTSQLINRLQDHISDKIELSSTQIKAIEILLKRTLPELSSIEHTGDPDQPVELRAVVEFVNADVATTKAP